MTREANVQSRIMLALGSRSDVTIFRNNIGKTWTGNAQRISKTDYVKVNPGDVVIRGARPFHAGLCKGSSDLIGWRTVEITPEMVGQKIAQFLAPEVKTGKGRATPEQHNFIRVVRESGGIAGLVRSPEEALEMVEAGLFAANDSQSVNGG